MTSKLSEFSGLRVLLLQGPPGPFFRRLATDLEAEGATVFKINFNAGDLLYYPTDSMLFRGKQEEWPEYFSGVLEQYQIDAVLFFGDCRPMHRVAHQIAEQRGIKIAVFEEGYVRPDYITFETHGVNGNSQLPRDAAFYHALPKRDGYDARLPVGETFWSGFFWTFFYYAAGIFGALLCRNYRHHRPLSLNEGFRWVRSLWRKYYYQWSERGLQAKLENEYSGRFYLAPLQVHNDAQIQVHSPMEGVSQFIREVIVSFARCAPEDTLLALKHHPLDRAYTDYKKLIRQVAEEMGVAHRVLYLHDQHLPSLLKNVRGVVVVNSTVGISAIHHGAPLMACGKAIYNMEGLSFQGCLDDFWTEGKPPDVELFRKFRHYVIGQTQLNGNFYRRISGVKSGTGVVWSPDLIVLPAVPQIAPFYETNVLTYYGSTLAARPKKEAPSVHESVA